MRGRILETVDPYDYQALENTLKAAQSFSHEKKAGVSVVITRRPCIRSRNTTVSKTKFQIGDNCDRCMTCVRDLECPAISFVKQDKKVQIDPDSCVGCGFCVEVCPSKAISVWGI